jgi:hypothetical protein
MKNTFSYRGAVSWNSLPAEIVDVHDQLSLYSFKTLINHHYKYLGGKYIDNLINQILFC